ncbi:MAG: LPS-assembly protein LptD [Pseudomonadota bacterium]
MTSAPFPPSRRFSLFPAKRKFVHCSLALLPLLVPVVVAAQPLVAPDASEIDWVKREDLTPEQLEQLEGACCGMYVEPALPAVEGEPGTIVIDGDPVNFAADGTVQVEGNLQIQQDGLTITADRGTYRREVKVATLENNIRIRQPGVLLTGTSAEVNRETGVSTLLNASYVLHETSARGSAAVIVRTDADGVITIDNGVFTRCEPGDNSWFVAGDNIVLNQQTGRGTARNVTLRVKDVPVMYLPWISFPLNDDRVSGFLAPVLGSTRDGGLDIATPYYLNLAPNYDATLTPRIQTERGVMLGAEGRYLGTNSQHLLDMQYLPNDDLYDPATRDVPGSDSPPVDDRWSLNYDFYALLARGWSAGIDYAAVSDRDYFQDLGNTGLYTTTQSYLYRDARVNYRGPTWNFQALTQGYQVIDPSIAAIAEPYSSLPRLNLDGTYYIGSHVEYGVDSEYVRFDRSLNPQRFTQDQINNGVMVEGERLAVTPRISLPWSNNYAFVTPTVKYKYANWNLRDQAIGTTASPDRSIFSANLDSGLIFERDLTLFDEELRQTFEPRLFYLYNQYEDQSDIPLFDTSDLTFSFNQLFRDDRFSGKDRVGDANQLTLAVSSRFYDSAGQEKARASIGQIQYFEDRRVTLFSQQGIFDRQSGSAVAGELGLQLADNWRASSYFEWNTTTNELDVANLQFQYQSEQKQLFNIGYRYRDMSNVYSPSGIDRSIDQSDVSAVWPVSDTWALVGRWNYDHANKRNLETIAGVEYTNCCYTVRVIARQWIDNDALFEGLDDDNTGVFIQFELKGLGSLLGGNVLGILNNGISGYREREYAQ